jgi:hypothetical protein
MANSEEVVDSEIRRNAKAFGERDWKEEERW